MAYNGKYSIAKKRLDERKNLGFDHRGRILLSTTDNNIWFNSKTAAFGQRLENFLNHLIKMCKSPRRALNYHAHQDSDEIN